MFNDMAMPLPRATFDAAVARDLPDTSGIDSSIVRKGGFAIARDRPVSYRANAQIAALHKNDYPLVLQTGFRVPQGILTPSPFWPSWAAHPSKFCGFHDSDSPLAFQVLHHGEWVHPDDVDLD
jgi:hypothetical protein